MVAEAEHWKSLSNLCSHYGDQPRRQNHHQACEMRVVNNHWQAGMETNLAVSPMVSVNNNTQRVKTAPRPKSDPGLKSGFLD